jgi:hypothetical protein
VEYPQGKSAKIPKTPRKEEIGVANTTKGYIGRISNSGAQVVTAPAAKQGKKGTGKTIKGTDLRAGKGK